LKGENSMTLEVIDKEIKDTNIRILKTATCPSLSGRSKLSYSLGCTEQKELLIRITKNSGGGKFNNSWHSLDKIIDLIDTAKKPFNWSALNPIFKGQSVNTAGFIIAVLKKEGLIRPLKKGGYERTTKDIKSLLTKSSNRRAS
jgi:hypothetical protein